jgi:DNA helicase INO80
MDSRFHLTMMQRPLEEDEGRERMNGTSGNSRQPHNLRSPTRTEFQPPFSPTKGVHPRPTFNNPYHPPTPAPLPLPSVIHVDKSPVSPLTTSYPTEYPAAPRDKPASNYYDPTSDSSERRPSETPSWYNGNAQTPQVS